MVSMPHLVIKVLLLVILLFLGIYGIYKDSSEITLIERVTGLNLPTNDMNMVYSYHESTWQESEATFVFKVDNDAYDHFNTKCYSSKNILSEGILSHKGELLANNFFLNKLLAGSWDCVYAGYSKKDVWVIILAKGHLIFRTPFYSKKTGAILFFD